MRAVLLMDERRILAAFDSPLSQQLTFVVIPGRPAASSQDEPGIHLALRRLTTWIPGSARKQRGRPRNDDKILREVPYVFTTLDQMVDDFLADAARM